MYRILMVWSGNRRRPSLPKERPVGSREISYSTASLHPVGVMMILIEMMMVGVMMILIAMQFPINSPLGKLNLHIISQF